jgi:hypothetical protein
LGNLLDQKAQASCPKGLKRLLGVGKARQLSCRVLGLAAEEERNRSAGDAMESFYRLVEAEGRLSLLLASQEEVQEALLQAEEMQAEGLSPPMEIAVIREQLTDLRTDEMNLRVAILQLNARLKVLLGLCGDYSLWPLADLNVVSEEIDVDEAVDYGLDHRPDLVLLGTLVHCVDIRSLAVAKQALAATSPMLGESASTGCYAALAACLAGPNYRSTKQQLLILLTDRRRQATEEIRQAVGQVDYRVQIVILARQNVETHQRRIKELEEEKTKGLDVEGELRTARLNLYQSQGEQLREVANWKIARAELLEVQGRLLDECACLAPSVSDLWPAPSVSDGIAPANATPMESGPLLEEIPWADNALEVDPVADAPGWPNPVADAPRWPTESAL